MFRVWLWLTGRNSGGTPVRDAYGVDIFLTADTEPRWLMADAEPVFLDADTEPTFLMAELPT